MKRLTLALALAAMSLCTLAQVARADFGFSSLDVTLSDSGDVPVTEAGLHPFSYTTEFDLNTVPAPPVPFGALPDTIPDGSLKDLVAELPPGLIGNPSAVQACPLAAFYNPVDRQTTCSRDSIVGRAEVNLGPEAAPSGSPLYNLTPTPGSAATLGFIAITVPVVLEVSVSPDPPYNIVTRTTDAYQAALLYGSKVRVWGNPADSAHDAERGGPAGIPEQAFLTLPRSCPGTPLEFPFSIASWQKPDVPVSQSATTAPLVGCEALDFDPDVGAVPTTPNADSPSGFGFSIDVDDPGLIDPDASAESDIKKVVVTLPEGLTVNPSSADGLGACSSAQLAAETASSDFGSACPASSKVASVQVETPLLKEVLQGSVFLATPYDNPFNSLLAGYLVIKSPERGVAIKLAGKIEPDPQTGRLVASFDDNPQLPFSHLDVSFKIGNRAPLVTPPTCGTYEIKTELYPWSGTAPLSETDSFTIDHGPDGGACQAGDPGQPADLTDLAALPHAPSFDAGSVSPIAGAHSPFVVSLRRADGSQRFSSVSLTPPQGLVAKLAGTAICSEGVLDAARSKSGNAEKGNPSCPPASLVGTVDVAAGAGPTPYHAQGKAYMAGPYKGAPLSLAIVTPATAGPFDLGTVVVRTALYVNSRTAEITAVSDSIPQILQGVPLDVRAAAVSLDRPEFTLNPTSCDPMAVSGQLISVLGQGAALSTRFQLGECGRLGFKPKMTLSLRGGTTRGKHPALTAVLTPRSGDANLAAISVALPRSEFLDQGHIGTVCTRVQFAADQCPAASIYGKATVHTPLLDYPLTGNVYLRSSDNTLPDLVPDLRGPSYQPLKLESAGRTDSIKGGIRNTFDLVPDAPFSKLVLQLPGGRKGLLINSRNICKSANRATVKYTAHNDDAYTQRPVIKAKCGKRDRVRNGKEGKHAN